MSKPRSLTDRIVKVFAKPKAYFRMTARSGSRQIRSHCQDALETGLKVEPIHPSLHGAVEPYMRVQ